MSSPNRKPHAFFHPVPQRVMTRRLNPDTGKLEECAPVLKSGQYISDARQIKKHLRGDYTYCRVERES
jgi:hypothetical protein